MSTTRIKEKLSKLVGNQLPEFIRADYNTFAAFLKAYYEFLEQDQSANELLQNARDYNDIDHTIDDFIEYFIKQYANDIPRNTLGNKQLLVKKINDLYSSKGSENSYNLLFQLLFGKQALYFYPGDQVFKASDGKWIQRSSIFVEMIYGSPDSFVNKSCKVINNNYISLVPFREKKSINEVVLSGISKVFTTSPDKFELFFDNINNPTISQGDFVQAEGALARVIPSPNKITVIDGGSGFKVGDLIDVEILRGTGTKVKVTKTNPGGVIRTLQLVSFGVNYPDTFFYNYSAEVARDEAAEFEIALPDIFFYDRTIGVADSGTISRFDYVSPDYLTELDYVGQLLSTFKYTEGVYEEGGETVDAIIKFDKGVKNFYPGYFKNNDGTPSGEIYLEDDKLYQPFSYVIALDEQLKKYKKAVMDLIHPAGMRLNAEYRIGVNVTLSQIVTTTLNFILNDFYDNIPVIEQLYYNLSKLATDTQVTDDTLALAFAKLLESANSINDSNVFYSMQKFIESSNVAIDTNFYVLDKQEESANSVIDTSFYLLEKTAESANLAIDNNFYTLDKSLLSSNSVSDSNVFYSLEKVLSSSNLINDSNVFYSLSKALESANSTADANIFYSFDKFLSNTVSTVDTTFLIAYAIDLISANSVNDANVFYSFNKSETSSNNVTDANVFYSLSKTSVSTTYSLDYDSETYSELDGTGDSVILNDSSITITFV